MVWLGGVFGASLGGLVELGLVGLVIPNGLDDGERSVVMVGVDVDVDGEVLEASADHVNGSVVRVEELAVSL